MVSIKIHFGSSIRHCLALFFLGLATLTKAADVRAEKKEPKTSEEKQELTPGEKRKSLRDLINEAMNIPPNHPDPRVSRRFREKGW